ncbi:NAD/NADP octopine/nopaline dehydrogenase family protein [Tropicimonas sp. IMCC6043]|uniref:NAD/NADP octopine/nopaline dehydrogenase family protein n=1 Tax=Tropicimonas sp. IMCC6043 TaxID=2510645 RepID=UPI00101B8EEA|nr:NAD/NADP octopine/nopaline dehydrogenase family protein [Tropicimonas sp. IMCC6043]RYH12247.1 NAD/NADP octopine/nopaline dehydrogenase [Tropicimonas sp. IMCC6043]
MKVSVIGGGPVGLTYAVLLMQAGHDVRLFSEAHRPSPDTRFYGAIETRATVPQAATLAEAVEHAEAMILARQATGTRAVLDAIATALEPSQTVIFSAELSFASFYLARRLRMEGREARCVSWSTTVATAHRTPEGIRVGTLRGTIDMASAGFDDPAEAVALCQSLFGDVFRPIPSPLAIGLSNLNPEVHLANTLGNLTRIETGEAWENYRGITPAVGRLIERLDLERLALARDLGFEVRSVQDHFRLTFPEITGESMHDLARQVVALGRGSLGPTTLATRYVVEDVPFGLVPLCDLGRRRNVPMVLHEAGIDLISVSLGTDFRARNDLLPAALDEIEAMAEGAGPH